MQAHSPPVLSVWTDAVGEAMAAGGECPGLTRIDGLASSPTDARDRAEQAYPGRDLLVLRAGAEVPDGLVARLHAALAAGDWDVVSPLDGRWPLFSPASQTAERDALAWTWGEHAVFADARWSAQCSLWRGTRQPQEGAAPKPLRAGYLPCAYVGPALAGDGRELPLPLKALQLRAADQSPPQRAQALPTVLHILHEWGGGVERFVRDLQAGDPARRHLVLVSRTDNHRVPYGRRLCLHDDLDQPALQTWPLAEPIGHSVAHSPQVARILQGLIAQWGVGAVLVSSLIGHSLDVLRTGLPTVCCVHDSYPLWPLLHDGRNPAAGGFDLESLAAGLAEAGPGFVLAGQTAEFWWALREQFLAAVAHHDVALVAPSEFARARLVALAPELAHRRWSVIAHGLAPLSPSRLSPAPRADHATLCVLVPGRIERGKGEHLLADMLSSLPKGVELVLLGSGHAGARFEGREHVQVYTDYQRDELADWVARLAPDLALLPSTAPETFSYTLSEMLALGLPVLCTDVGAPAERLRQLGRGWITPPSASAVNQQLAQLVADRSLVEAVRRQPPAALPGLAQMASAWSEALPVAPAALVLEPASPEQMSRLALQVLSGQLRHELAQTQQELTEAWRELDRRAAWAQGLQRQLEESQLQVRRLEEYVQALDEQLAQAHGYYQRDSTDLAQQRDIALAQRDDAIAGLKAVHDSLLWRATRWPRALLRRMHHAALALAYRLTHARSLLSRGIASLRSRGLAGTARRIRERRLTGSQAHPALLAQATRATDSPLRLPRPVRPRASIIIPVYNQLNYTLACLRSLSDCADATPFEVIVVDDASGDASARVLPGVPGLRYHRNPENLGFIGACNVGAELASGEFLVFLNNDTTVESGWLDALLSTFAQHPDTGLAGSKLVYPDGRLQEAGGIVFSDGSGWNYGRFEDPNHPRFNFVREVDYCSGAALALRRELFLRLGGFDSHYAPAYYEDTDLAMRVRELGLKVRYQPASVVIHHEGVSSGTDVRSGVKAYQVANQAKFVARWSKVLSASHARPGTDPAKASERNRGKQVLVLDACTPTPDRDSGSVRMLALLGLLREEGCSVVFFPENSAHDGGYTEALQQLGVEAWWHPYLGTVPAWLAANGRRFDLVIASRHYVLSPLLPLLRNHARRAHVVFDTVDLHHLREQREAEVSGDPAQLRTAARTRRLELGLIQQADTTWVVSPLEQELLAAEAPQARVEVVSNIHDVHGPGQAWQEREGLLFVGSYRHPPNVDAARWLATEIFPLVRQQLPDVTLHLVGGDAPDAIVALGELPGVRFHGYVADLLPLLDGSRVGLAPLRYGAGVKGKVNQSLAHGLPMVATGCAVEGMHLVDGKDVLVAEDAAAFAQAVVRLYRDQVLWERLSLGGLENTRRYFSRDAVRETLRASLARLGR
jgi:GT2 family glycosyltransferase/glycosyltransferase involved in cell wall biosynthesis